jgi:hypothetical protein
VIVVWKKLQKDLGIEDRNRRKRKTKTFDLVKNREDLDTLSKFLGDYSFYEIRGGVQNVSTMMDRLLWLQH